MTKDSSDAIHDHGLHFSAREIYVHPLETGGEIDELVAARFLKNLHMLERHSSAPITVHFSTCGGSWDYGMAMFDAIEASPCWVETVSHSWARSMSSVIPQAADYRWITPHCSFMAHYGDEAIECNAVAFQSYAEHTMKTHHEMVAIYARRCRHAPYFKDYDYVDIESFLEGRLSKNVDWWLDAEQAIEFGFMDELWQ